MFETVALEIRLVNEDEPGDPRLRALAREQLAGKWAPELIAGANHATVKIGDREFPLESGGACLHMRVHQAGGWYVDGCEDRGHFIVKGVIVWLFKPSAELFIHTGSVLAMMPHLNG